MLVRLDNLSLYLFVHNFPLALCLTFFILDEILVSIIKLFFIFLSFFVPLFFPLQFS